MTSESFPKLRWPLDVQLMPLNGEEVILLRDQSGIATEPVVVPIVFGPVLGRLDGCHSVPAIVSASGISEQVVRQLLSELDRLYYLENPKSEARSQSVRREFGDADTRPAVFAGKVYGADPHELNRTIAQFLEDSALPHRNSSLKNLSAVIAPHIDYRRGWRTYCATHRVLSCAEKPDVIVLLGTAHQPATGLFHLSRKHFTGPFGTFTNDRRFTDAVADRFGRARAFREELLHRTEHSLELQLPFLWHCYRDRGLPLIVPVLVGSFASLLRNGRTSAELDDFVSALSDEISNRSRNGERILLFGGVDLAHMGRHFGDPEPLSDRARHQIEEEDREFMTAAVSGNAHAVFEHVAKDLDRRRLCGFPSIYTMLEILHRTRGQTTGQLEEYRQAFDAPSDCLVTFASAAWQ